MSSPFETDVIGTASALYTQRDYARLRAFLQGQPSRLLVEYPELGFMQVSAFSRAGEQKKARILIDRILRTRVGKENSSLHRRLVNARAVADLEGGRSISAYEQWTFLLEKSTAAGDQQMASWACANIGIVKSLFCEWAEALVYFERARIAFHGLGSTAELAAIHNNLGETYRQLQRYDLAIDNVDHAIEYGTAAGTTDDLSMCYLTKARLASDIGDLETAKNIAGRCYAEFIQQGSLGREGEALYVLGDIALKNLSISEAEGHFIAALAKAERLQIKMLQAECLEKLGHVKDLRGDEKGRRSSVEMAVKTYQEIGAFARSRKVIFEN